MSKHRVLRLEQLQRREMMAADLAALVRPNPLATYSIDGTGNNVAQVEWGSTQEQQLRLAKAEYGDGISTPAGASRPSARQISNVVSDQGDADVISANNLSAFVYVWGQFIDHDLGLTPTAANEQFNISVPTGDAYFDPKGTGTKFIPMTRSAFDPATGASVTSPRQQLNALTAWIDGSMIYGSDTATALKLRTLEGGHLKLDSDGMLPENNTSNFPTGPVPMVNGNPFLSNDKMLAAGDIRANENVELTGLHTLFVREHNRWADRIKSLNPSLNDEQVYLRARAMVIAEIQSITYNEWLPALLGRDAIAPYRGYNPKVNPQISVEFSTAAFRFGHSLLGDDVGFLDKNGRPIAEELSLSEAFFNPTVFDSVSIDSIMKYLASDPSSELDSKVVGSVRNFLFGPPGAGGLDLASLNIQRGRDHGLADYNDTRAAVGLPRVRSFAEITRNTEMQQKLAALYGSVDNIDLWVGILVEDHVPGTSFGPTGARIIAQQFARLRDGDRFWFQSAHSGKLLQELQNTHLVDVVARNTELKNLQPNVFFFKAEIGGTVFVDANANARVDRGEAGLGGISLELVSQSSGETIAQAKTDAQGRYLFNVASGIRTDTYFVRLLTDATGKTLTQRSRPVQITGGDQFVRNVDIGVPTPNTRTNRPQSNTLTTSNLASTSNAALDPATTDLVMNDLQDPKRRRV
jgi:peroxidase